MSERSPLSSRFTRFALEAGFIILVGVIAAVLDLGAVAIVAVIGIAAALLHSREFAKSDGALRSQFDSLVRESFPELTRTLT